MKTQQQTPLTQAAKPADRHEPDGPRQQQVDASPRQQAQQQRLAQLHSAAHPNGLPAPLQQGLEALSGLAMHDVRVHRNSDKPAQLQAHAYAQGRDIYLAPGQERHLAHEAWHIVQQKQGRVSPNRQMPAGVGVNDDPGLEQEADRMGARALQARANAALSLASRNHEQGAADPSQPVQRVIYKDKGKQEKNRFKDLPRSDFYKQLANDQERAWALALHSKTDEHYNLDEARAKIAELMQAAELPPPLPEVGSSKKRKRTEPTVARVTGAATGKQVDYATDKKFRTERRVIRRLEKAGKSPGDRNIYVKRFKPNDASKGPYKLVTSSLPPSGLPADYASQDVDALTAARLGQTKHSEGVNDKIEQDYQPLHERKFKEEEDYSTSSREQCEVCRYQHPPHKPGAHVFGSFYSGTTDHIKDDALREKLVKNQGIIGDLELTPSERELVAEARKDAAAARQHDPQQNPLLATLRSKLTEEDSLGEQSSDDDDVYVEEALHWGSTTGWGKGKVIKIARREYFTDKEFEAEKEKTIALLARKASKGDGGVEEVADERKDDEDDPMN